MNIISLYQNSQYFDDSKQKLQLTIEQNSLDRVSIDVDYDDFINFLINENLRIFFEYFIVIDLDKFIQYNSKENVLNKIYNVCHFVEMKGSGVLFRFQKSPDIVFSLPNKKNFQLHVFADMFNKVNNKSIHISTYSWLDYKLFNYGLNSNNNQIKISVVDPHNEIMCYFGKSVSELKLELYSPIKVENIILPNLMDLSISFMYFNIDLPIKFIIKNSSIRHLHINHPQTGYQISDELIQFLCENKNITSLKLHGGVNKIQIAKILELNDTLISLDILACNDNNNQILLNKINSNFTKINIPYELNKSIIDCVVNMTNISNLDIKCCGSAENNDVLVSYLEKYPQCHTLGSLIYNSVKWLSYGTYFKSRKISYRTIVKNRTLIFYLSDNSFI